MIAIALIWLAACVVFTPIACAFFHAARIADQRESEGCGEGEGDGAWVHGRGATHD